MKKASLVSLCILFQFIAFATCKQYYIVNYNPWGKTTNQTAMNNVFGAGVWTQANYSVNPNTVFSNATTYVMMEGSDANADALNTFSRTTSR